MFLYEIHYRLALVEGGGLMFKFQCSISYLLDDTEVAGLFVQLSLAEVDHHVLVAQWDLEEGHQDGGE